MKTATETTRFSAHIANATTKHENRALRAVTISDETPRAEAYTLIRDEAQALANAKNTAIVIRFQTVKTDGTIKATSDYLTVDPDVAKIEDDSDITPEIIVEHIDMTGETLAVNDAIVASDVPYIPETDNPDYLELMEDLRVGPAQDFNAADEDDDDAALLARHAARKTNKTAKPRKDKGTPRASNATYNKNGEAGLVNHSKRTLITKAEIKEYYAPQADPALKLDTTNGPWVNICLTHNQQASFMVHRVACDVMSQSPAWCVECAMCVDASTGDLCRERAAVVAGTAE